MENNSDKVKLFVDSLLNTNRGYSFFVNWNNTKEAMENSIELHAMDSLIKCNDFKTKFYELLDKLPEVITTFPLLFALSKAERDKLKKGKMELKIANHIKGVCEEFKFDIEGKRRLDDNEKERYYDFFVNMGLKNLFDNIIEKSVTDYVIGVLVGLDSNGRKNRSGTAFEDLCEKLIAPICSEYGITLLLQKQFKVLEDYGIKVNEDIANRKADFILIKDKVVLNIEANYYFAAGSKPEEIVDSYINRNNDLNDNKINFILITDGNCWDNEGKNQLNKAFRYISLMNYKMAESGCLKSRINEIFNLK
ncbi:DpnII family type II restriction endonuclease [Mesomycoplasma ovipneumoniae]|uniref:Type-2 restriction enzyme n=1 Tax=Mesomycoplasma ovipneumoniae TaxID=29562 RepID=A0AAW6Q6A9_9BACT|nr:DpnII family type II restriction endonuclease [Mesomycoplasma ovipneumoniae]MDF9627395.1 DpnII family type II restriction endonuclease [Mesomycoplasma ovipneumoniae]MDO4157494.1 DpnII family type II restriction endonuclease [Mesomycoplasma ovipneumoniae]MDO4158581.1 DpnII family type II restriction endonuclease [Mesomycoplasma ovipneumoniae]MDO6821501.1 DpnII family type II restriction endonuclease [Mesomycoplasma ovipneumoniae]MDO6856079.1 DpnII family type II restriction endonuclease [Mes